MNCNPLNWLPMSPVTAAVAAIILGLSPGVALAQIVSGAAGSGPPRDQRPALPPQDFVRAAYALTDSDFATRVRGIPEKRAPKHLYGDDGEGSLLVLSDDGIVSLSPDGATRMRIPFQRLRNAGVEEAELTGPGTRSRDDGSIFTVNSAGDVRRIPEDTNAEIETVVTKAQMEAFARGSEVRVNDLLWANHVVWIASEGNAGLMRYDPDNGSLAHLYDPIQDLTDAFTGTTDAGVKSLAYEAGRAEILFSVGWDVGGADGGAGRIGGVDGDGVLFRLFTRDDGFLEDEPLPRGMAALGGGAYVIAQRDGELFWFNYTPDFERMTLEGALNILRALVDDVDDPDAPEVKTLGVAADCEGRAYVATTLGIVTTKEPERELIPGDVLLVTRTDRILRVTGFGEPMVFREGGLGAGASDEALALQTANAIARSPIDGHIAVADEGAQRIFRFSPDGLKLPEYEVDLAYQVGFASDGTLYYLDRNFLVDRDDEFERRNLQSSVPSVVGRPAVGNRVVHYQFDDIDWDQTAMAVRPDGTTVVAQVWVGIEPDHDPPGRLVQIGKANEDGDLGELEVLYNLEEPTALYIDTGGDLWIGEKSTQDDVAGRLLRVAAGSDQLETILPRPGEINPLKIPGAIAETDDGRLIIADREADVYAGSTRTGGLFFLNKDGTGLRVLLDHPEYPQPASVGVIYVPPFECTSFRDCPLPHCRVDKRVCPPSDDCEEDAASCPPAEQCEESALQCPGVACNLETGQCRKAERCEIVIGEAPKPPDEIGGSEPGCLECSSAGPGRAWLKAILRR